MKTDHQMMYLTRRKKFGKNYKYAFLYSKIKEVIYLQVTIKLNFLQVDLVVNGNGEASWSGNLLFTVNGGKLTADSLKNVAIK